MHKLFQEKSTGLLTLLNKTFATATEATEDKKTKHVWQMKKLNMFLN